MKAKVWPSAHLQEQRHHHSPARAEKEGSSQSPILMPAKATRAQNLGAKQVKAHLATLPSYFSEPQAAKVHH